jgi:hypothetical protein
LDSTFYFLMPLSDDILSSNLVKIYHNKVESFRTVK